MLLWGGLTLLARAPVALVRGLLPRVGPPVPSDALLDDAIGLHRDGFTWEAEQIYRHILWQWPDHTSALHLLGVVLHQNRQHEGEAIPADWTRDRVLPIHQSDAFFNNYERRKAFSLRAVRTSRRWQ